MLIGFRSMQMQICSEYFRSARRSIDAKWSNRSETRFGI